MSKKIAQLTKVIYHLNTVNEDNTFSTETRAKSHQNELTTILKDASSKINKFRDIVEEKRSAVNAEAELTQLKTKHDKEKAAAHDKIKSIQLNFDTRYDTLRDECSQKILDLRDEAATYKAKLAECIRTFEDKQRQLREAYDKNKGVAGNEVEAMKRKHQVSGCCPLSTLPRSPHCLWICSLANLPPLFIYVNGTPSPPFVHARAWLTRVCDSKKSRNMSSPPTRSSRTCWLSR